MSGLLSEKLSEHPDYERHRKEEYPIAVLLHEYKDYKVVYIDCSVKMPEPFGWYSMLDSIRIFKSHRYIAKHEPALDPYVDINENIISVTSDGRCWIYDLDKEKELFIEMPIVAFYNNIVTSPSWFSEEHKDNDKLFAISGTGCVWGCEADEIPFELYIDKEKLELVDTIYYDEEE